MKGLLIVFTVAVSAPVSAEVYRCEQGGKALYTDRPCAAGAAPAALPAINTVPGLPDAPALADQFDESRKREANDRAEADTAWLKRQKERTERESAVRAALIEGRVVAGMTPAQVERVLNLPARVEDRGGPNERWVYQTGKKNRTIAFRDGVVSSDGTGKRQKAP